jgi:hypothetical protein
VCLQPGQLLLVMLTIKTNAIGLTSRSYHAPYHILWIKKFRNEFQWSESTYLSNHRTLAKIIHSFPASLQVHRLYSATGRTGVCGYIHILHATPQTWLYAIGLPSKNEHDKSPTQTREDGPGICSYLFSELKGEKLCGDGGDRDGG